MTMHYQVGKSVPLDFPRRPLSDRETFDAETGEFRPEWYILKTPPMMEVGAIAWLKFVGALEVWHPTETKWRKQRGKRGQVPYERSIAPGYLFTLLDREPNWDVLFERAGKKLSGVVGVHERPLVIPEKVIANMRQVPERIERLKNEEAAAELEARLAKAPRENEDAVIAEGPLAGKVVTVSRIHGGVAHFILQGIKMQATTSSLERVAAE